MLPEAYYQILGHRVFHRFEQLFDEFALNWHVSCHYVCGCAVSRTGSFSCHYDCCCVVSGS